MNQSILDSEKLHLAELFEAVQRCVYFLDASSRKLTWPLTKERLQTRKKDVTLFEAEIAGHFNSLQVLTSILYKSADRFLNYCQEALGIEPKQADFSTEFMSIVQNQADDNEVAK